MEEHPSPEECFTFWRSRVDKKYDDDVNEVVAQFLADAQMHEVRYPYHHPHWGSIFVRCGGRRVSADGDPVVRITGYHQDVTEVHAVHQSLRESLSRLSLACRLGQLGVFELRFSEGDLELTANEIFAGPVRPAARPFGRRARGAVEARLLPGRSAVVARPCCGGIHGVPADRNILKCACAHPRRGLCWLKLAYEVVGEAANCRVAGYSDDVTEHRLHEQMLREAKETAEAANAAKSIFWPI